jgi:carboxylesterase type B
MVWIHGGGFYAGSGNSNFYGPDHLMSEDVVLVTINYRLGALGQFYNLLYWTLAICWGIYDVSAVKSNPISMALPFY